MRYGKHFLFVFICICNEGYEDTLTGKTVGSLFTEAFKIRLDKYHQERQGIIGSPLQLGMAF